MSESSAIQPVVVDHQAPNNAANPAKLLEMAVQSNVDIDKLEKLVDLQEKWEAGHAKKQFFSAFAKFQAAVPAIGKNKNVGFKNTSYNHASLDNITATIKESMDAARLSYRFEFPLAAGAEIIVTCVITHESGHSVKTTMSGPADVTGSKNPIQSRASSITYLQRYTLCGALGLTPTDEDTDGITNDVGDTASPSAPAREWYPENLFAEKIESWRLAIKDEIKTPDEVIAFVENKSKRRLTQAQKDALREDT